jgi:SAM-dependent methyltransferase
MTDCILCGRPAKKNGLAECACGLVFISNPKKMDYENADGYYYLASVNDDLKTFYERLELIEPYLKKTDTVLDIGTSIGTFLLACRQRFTNLYGVELNSKAREIGIERGLKITETIPQIKADLVNLGDVIEHFDNPLEELIKLKNNMHEDSIIVIVTPDYEKLITKLVNIKPREHLFYFNKKTLYTLLTKAGYEILYLGNVTRYRKFKNLVTGRTASNPVVRLVLQIILFLRLDGIVEGIFFKNLGNDLFCVAKLCKQ